MAKKKDKNQISNKKATSPREGKERDGNFGIVNKNQGRQRKKKQKKKRKKVLGAESRKGEKLKESEREVLEKKCYGLANSPVRGNSG